jgi:hypothetical protein
MGKKYHSSNLPRFINEANKISQSQPNEELIMAIKEY